MADISNADKGLRRPKLDCYYDEKTSSVLCWKALEQRMSARLASVKAQKLGANFKENENSLPLDNKKIM